MFALCVVIPGPSNTFLSKNSPRAYADEAALDGFAPLSRIATVKQTLSHVRNSAHLLFVAGNLPQVQIDPRTRYLEHTQSCQQAMPKARTKAFLPVWALHLLAPIGVHSFHILSFHSSVLLELSSRLTGKAHSHHNPLANHTQTNGAPKHEEAIARCDPDHLRVQVLPAWVWLAHKLDSAR